jgi:hypothetical protein
MMAPCELFPFCEHDACRTLWLGENEPANRDLSPGYEACGLWLTYEDYSTGFRNLILLPTGLTADDLNAALHADQELASYAIGMADGPCLETSIETLGRLARGAA